MRGGWEAWLESDADPRIDNRIVDTYLVWAFPLIALALLGERPAPSGAAGPVSAR